MRLRSWEIALVVVSVFSLSLLGVARTLGAHASSREEAVTRIARPGVAFWGEPVDVEVRIDANGLPSCAAPADVEPIYAVLVLDHSGSMAGTPLAEARNAASDFADLMNLTTEGDAVAVVTFDDTAELPIGLSHDRGQVVRTIQDILEGGGTNIADGLDLAAQQFSAHPPPADARRVIILLSDGEQTEPGDPIATADRVKVQGIRVVSIALGDADRSTLAQIASSGADYYETADPATLMEIYGEIAAGIVGTIATDVTLTEYLNNTHFTLINTGLYRAQQTDSQIVWRLPFVGRRGRSVGYFLRPRSLGWHRISPDPGQMRLTDCEGNLLVQATPVGPHVLVLFPVWLLYIAPALASMWLLYRLGHALRRRSPGPVEPQKPRPRPREEIAPTTKEKPKPRPTGEALVHDWTTETIVDQRGRPLKMRIRPDREAVEQGLRTRKSATMHIRVDEGDREVGRARLTVEVLEQFDPLTGETHHRRRARLEAISVEKESQQHGVGSLILRRVEALAQEHGAQEIHGVLDPRDARHFFESRGYQVRRGPQGDLKVFKVLVESP